MLRWSLTDGTGPSATGTLTMAYNSRYGHVPYLVEFFYEINGVCRPRSGYPIDAMRHGDGFSLYCRNIVVTVDLTVITRAKQLAFRFIPWSTCSGF